MTKQKLELTWIGEDKRTKLSNRQISQLEVQLDKQADEQTLFTIEWELK